jgi:hypothetical protein
MNIGLFRRSESRFLQDGSDLFDADTAGDCDCSEITLAAHGSL